MDEKIRRVYVPMTETGFYILFPAGGTSWLSCNSICEKNYR